jgi:L-cysteine desulfidase
MFHNQGQFQTMEHKMAMYTTVVAPFICSLRTLEAALANTSNVYIFWLAIIATLKELFVKGEDNTGIPPSPAYKISAVYNT